MLTLRKILLCNALYYALLLFSLLAVGYIILHPKTSNYTENSSSFTGRVIQIKEKKGKEYYYVKNKEIVIATSSNTTSIQLGDKVKIKGRFQKPNSTNDPILWDYQDYLNHQNIFYFLQIDSIEVLSKNHNLYYSIKQILINRMHHNPYLHAFLLGDKFYLSSEIKRAYQEIGISHLFAISGMHISLLTSLFQKLGKKRKQSDQTIFIETMILLLLYLSLVGLSPSMLRGILFYGCFTLNNLYYFYIPKHNICILVLAISLLLKPSSIYEVGFYYSHFISFSLVMCSSKLKANTKLGSLLKTSTLSFLVSCPITLYEFYQWNLLSILFNLFFVPFVSIIIFPMSFLVLFYPPLEIPYNGLIQILEKISFLASNLSLGKMIFKKVTIFLYILYFVLLLLWLIKKQKSFLIILILLLGIHYSIPYFKDTIEGKILDVNQGDSIYLRIHNKNILIDTGGEDTSGTIFYNRLSPYLKAEGVSKIHTLILTHGDFDHMGEAINLVNNFRVEKVIFNCGEYNDLEKELIKVLDKKKIKYYSCIKELNVDKNKLYFLQTKVYDNENDNSNVIYTELNGYKFMYMGDASNTTEHEILNEYNLPDIDVLKVGHHGSKTSSSKEFINEINPKYSIISVGKNNRYGHPNKEALDNLKESKIYRTDQDGSIMFKIKNNKLKIETCSP